VSDVALRFGAKDDGLTAQFRKVDKQLEQFRTNGARAASGVASAFSVLPGILAAVGLAKLSSEAFQTADAIKKVQDQTGFTSAEVQRLSFIGGQASVDLGNVSNAALKLQRSLGGVEEGSGDAKKTLADLGLANDAFFASGPDEQFEAVAKAIAGISDQNERVLVTTNLFGKAGAELLPVIKAIGEESAKIDDRFASIGGPVGEAAINTIDDLGDAFAATKTGVTNLAIEILAAFGPAAQVVLGAFNDLLRDTRDILSGRDGDPTNDAGVTKNFQKGNQSTFTQAILAGRLEPIADIPVNLSAPTLRADQFEETDDQRKAREQREKEDSDARLQRLQQIASMHQIEEDMAFRSSLKLAEIDQRTIDDSVRRATDEQSQKLRITSAFEAAMQQSRELFGLQQINFEDDKNTALIGLSTTLFSSLAEHNSKFAKAQQALAIVTVIYDTSRAIMRAFGELSFAGFAMAGLMAAQGALQISKIKSTNYSGGSVSGSAPTLSGGSSVGAREGASRDVPAVSSAGAGATTVYVSGMITKEVTDYLIQGLREGFTRDVLVIPTNSLQAQVIRNGA
jgi:hypothetical protein